tara:strand:+ start:10891 stop:11964 length:1074 start_codon:yes stop_codon:yes gene_type:complete
MKNQKEKVIDILSDIKLPNKNEDLISSKSVKDIKYDKELTTITLSLNSSAYKYKEIIKRNCLFHFENKDPKTKYGIKFVLDKNKDDDTVKSNKKIEKTIIQNIKNIIAISSGKGGVGKSTISSNISVSLSKLGYRVGLIDADIFGPSIPTIFNTENEQPNYKIVNKKNIIIPLEQYGIKLISMGNVIPKEKAVIWRGPMASSALKQLFTDVEWGKLDYLVVDLPPGTSDIHITLSQNFNITGTIIVSTPQKVSTIDAEKAISMFQHKNTNIPIVGLIENMSYFKNGGKKHYLFGDGGAKKIAKKHSIQFLGEIPVDNMISKSCDSGYPITLKENYISDLFMKISKNIDDKIISLKNK